MATPSPNGSAIRARRERAGFGLNEFARACRIDPATLSRIERGQAACRWSTLRRIANELGVAIAAITI